MAFRSSDQRLRGGIAVGMATNIPPHNLSEVSGHPWFLEHPESTDEVLLTH